MKTEKLNFKSIKNVLSKAEMKKIMAGSGGNGSGCYVSAGPGGCPNGGICTPDFGGNHGTCQ